MCMAGIIDVSLTAVNITQTHIHTHTHAHTHPSRLDKGVVQTGPLNAQQMKKTCSSISPVQRTQATEMGQRWVSVCVPMCVYMQATGMGQRWVSVCVPMCVYMQATEMGQRWVSACVPVCVYLRLVAFVFLYVCLCALVCQRHSAFESHCSHSQSLTLVSVRPRCCFCISTWAKLGYKSGLLHVASYITTTQHRGSMLVL